eukprot:COSAG06_NODE_23266_length_697_cov_1.423077_1_plen_36_part_10
MVLIDCVKRAEAAVAQLPDVPLVNETRRFAQTGSGQ